MGDPYPQLRPIGRRVTPQRAEFRRLAQSAEVGTVTRGQLAVLAQNLPCTGLINATEAHLLVTLINTASADTFDKAGRPIIFKSNQQLAFEINRSTGRVSRLLSSLFDAGLITMQDSGNYKRYPVRNAHGSVVDGCGIDMRILIVRYRELDELVRQARAERAAASAALRRYRGALRNLRYALATVTGLFQRARARLEARLEKIVALVGVAAKAPSALLRRATGLFEWLIERVLQLPRHAEAALETQDLTCTNAENGMHKQITSPDPLEDSNDRRSADTEQLGVLAAGSARKWALETSLGRGSRQVNQQQRPPQEFVGLHDVVRAVPALKTYGFALPRTWGDLARLVPQMCRLAGISDDARRRAVEQMGEQQAAVAVAVILQKFDRQELSSPGGYLRAMTHRAAAGELHLARSVFGLAARHSMEVLN
ncbi:MULTISPECIES: plasmid replication protein RepC [unclassified Mesorhizobium]|uniref:plasmid replication protein RepC n=1 Tax=unclassified Mesorhizobium TaxID=325217 RepID=UPI000FCAAD89|nr:MULTISPECIES: plasmid replication protein RepC [unclassified Mesorhizobium]RUV92012.1 replication protein C [Mesorhizobium sp. M1A.F.Ca.IN.020.04.1.1]RWH18217.1 MAG: replication protein C [Mesorhizobium sp.]RWH40307.1 MAG: replication protein C [Mesorhizobium sp.]TIR57708.1 MAG: replication protein C [Mesorhizobium sp.]TIR72126.1 MAG: replication protein C [Mesorhizobium sp.]